MTWTRRQFLTATAAAGAGLALGACGGNGPAEDAGGPTTAPADLVTIPPVDFGPPVGDNPFTLGVASGDPDANSVVLWTAVDRTEATTLTVEVARDDAFAAIVSRSEVTADPVDGMTARVIATGLASNTVHWYRFALDGHVTPAARTRTAPAAGVVPDDALTVAHLSCMRRSSGYWMALDDVAAIAPDVVVHCGDYVYEDDGGSVRPSDIAPPTTLDEYRDLWRRYKVDPALQAAHAVAPWLIVWDDHEVENNYQGNDPGDPPDGAAFLDQRTAAYRAWWEFTPTRVAPPDGGPNLTTYRTIDWGGLTRFVLLDTRQYRDDQPCESTRSTDVGPRCDQSATLTMLGDAQEAWFDDAAQNHDARWTTVVQQVVLQQWRFLGGNILWNLDQWDGYPGARRRLLATLADAPSPVVLSGDVHSSWVSDLWADFDADDAVPVGVEFVAPGVSSDVPSSLEGVGSLVELSSPHIAWSETRRRGWVLHTISGDDWSAEYRLVDNADLPDSPVSSERTFTVGDHIIHR